MDLRSMLFVPGDSERKLAKGENCGGNGYFPAPPPRAD